MIHVFNVNSVTIVSTINLYIPVGLHINARNVYETKNEAGGELMRNNMFGLTFSDIRHKIGNGVDKWNKISMFSTGYVRSYSTL